MLPWAIVAMDSAWELRDANAAEAVRIIEDVRSSTTDRLAHACCDTVEAFLASRRRNNEETLALGRSAERYFADAPQSRWVARLYCVLSGTHQDLGAMDVAFDYLARGIAIATRVGDTCTLFTCHHDMALLRASLGHFEMAEEAFLTAERYADTREDCRAFLAFNRAEMLHQQGRTSEAWDLLADNEHRWNDGSMPMAELFGCTGQADLAERLGNSAEASRHLDRARQLAQLLRCPMPDHTLIDARIRRRLGSEDEALYLLHQTLAEPSCDPQQRIAAFDLIAEIEEERGRYRAALHAYRSARTLADDLQASGRSRAIEINIAERTAQLAAESVMLEAQNTALTRSMSELQSLHEQVVELSIRDDLTGLYNRRHLLEQGDALLWLAKQTGQPLSMIVVDVDHFKAVNDHYLHSVGDEVLRDVANILVAHTRSNDIVGRYGGDEFIALLPNTDAAGAARIAERIRQRVEGHDWSHVAQDLTLSVSIGAAEAADEHDATLLFHQADAQLYAAKRSGRNTVAS